MRVALRPAPPLSERTARRGQSEPRALRARSPAPQRPELALGSQLALTWLARLTKPSVMDKRAASGRGEPIPSILKKPKSRRKGDLVDKSTKIKREKVEGSKKGGDASAPLPQGCTPLMYACQQADYKAVVDNLNKDVSSSSPSSCMMLCLSAISKHISKTKT